MTDNMRKYMELVEGSEDVRMRIAEEQIRLDIAIAAENGIELTDADFASLVELGDDDLDGVSGGSMSDHMEHKISHYESAYRKFGHRPTLLEAELDCIETCGPYYLDELKAKKS